VPAIVAGPSQLDAGGSGPNNNEDFATMSSNTVTNQGQSLINNERWYKPSEKNTASVSNTAQKTSRIADGALIPGPLLRSAMLQRLLPVQQFQPPNSQMDSAQILQTH